MSISQNHLPDSENNSFTLRYLPPFLHGYAQLMRLDRPAGWWLLLLPCWVSLTLGAIFTRQPFYVFWLEYGLFFIGAVVMRGAGCTYNDIIDRDIDAQIARTQNRPLPSGRVSLKKAQLFLLLQLSVGLAILLAFDKVTIFITLFSLIFVAIYPFAKRFTNWPQFFLGLAFNWGIWSGWFAATGEFHPIALLLYLGFIAWTIGYDTIYAHQDENDDAIVGVKSTALLFGKKSLFIIAAFYAFTSLCLVGCYLLLQQRILLGDVEIVLIRTTIGIGIMQLLWQLLKVDLTNWRSCLHIFRANHQFGLILTGGFALASLV